jgi:hypothetical protein
MKRKEMIRRLAFDVFASPELMQLLCQNTKIDYDEDMKTFAYKVFDPMN